MYITGLFQKSKKKKKKNMKTNAPNTQIREPTQVKSLLVVKAQAVTAAVTTKVAIAAIKTTPGS